jgi:hypothetical protein
MTYLTTKKAWTARRRSRLTGHGLRRRTAVIYERTLVADSIDVTVITAALVMEALDRHKKEAY